MTAWSAQNPMKGQDRLEAELVTDPDRKPVLTVRQACSASRALCRGLAQYLARLQQTTVAGGRVQLIQAVFDTMPEEQDLVQYQRGVLGAVLPRQPGALDASSLTPQAPVEVKGPVKDTLGRYPQVQAIAELNQVLGVEIWGTEASDQDAFALMLEQALNPVDWMYGLRLSLPFYFGLHATYEPRTTFDLTTSEEAKQRIRRVQMEVMASVKMMRQVSFPSSQPRFVLQSLNDQILSE